MTTETEDKLTLPKDINDIRKCEELSMQEAAAGKENFEQNDNAREWRRSTRIDDMNGEEDEDTTEEEGKAAHDKKRKQQAEVGQQTIQDATQTTATKATAKKKKTTEHFELRVASCYNRLPLLLFATRGA